MMERNQSSRMNPIKPKSTSSSEKKDSQNPVWNSNYRELFQRIQRRSGEIVDFDKSKITEAIWKAARSVGGTDRRTADLLADKVILYLSRTYDDHLLTIEEVQDAVEKVLIENGHARTAKAYILYREERARVRKFREGRRALQPAPAFDSTMEQEVEVLTSGEQLVHWNRERITQTLIRETGLAWALADRISREVEKQIIYSKTSRLTASLIRELVNVKLLEYGFTGERQLHSRLGVPLYDVEQMVLGGAEGVGRGQLEQALSGSVVRQYALGRIYSSEVSEAHLRGDINLHGLTAPWKIEETLQSLDYLKKVGLCFPDFSSRWAPAESASELISQLGKFNHLLEGAVRKRSIWDGVNIFLAPYLDGQDESALRRVAHQLLYEISTRPAGGGAPVHSLGFYFHIPKSLWNTAALGSGGRYSGKTYAYYEETARRFLRIMLDTQAECASHGQPFQGAEFVFHLDGQFFDSAQAVEDLELLEHRLPNLGRWCAWVHSRSASRKRLNHFCLSEEEAAEVSAECKYPWKMRSNVSQVISLNLPAIALQAEHDQRELDSLLDQQLHLVFTAFRQRRQFLEKLSAMGVEASVRQLEHQGDGEPFLRASHQRCRLAIWGLGEMVEWHLGQSFVQDAACRNYAEAFLSDLMHRVEVNAQSSRMMCEVSLASDAGVARRFRNALAASFEPLSDLAGEVGIKPLLEPSDLSKWAGQLSATPEMHLSPSQIGATEQLPNLASLLRESYSQNRDERLLFSQPVWMCQTCTRLLRGAPDICPHCGSLQLASLEG